MYYISSGFGNGMYTLREHYLVKTNYGMNEKDGYIKTLSRDFDKAIAKAQAYVGDTDKLQIGKEFDLEKWGEADNSYRYVAPEPTAEEIAEREAKAKANAKADAEWAETKRLEQEAYDSAEPVPVTDERIEFTGVIEKTYFKENQWGGSFRMFFIDDRGFKLNGSVGSAFTVKHYDEDGDYRTRNMAEGTRVSFVAKVTISEDDPKFGFFKRPTKVKAIEEK